MAGFARVEAIGNFGKDPVVRFAQSGTAVCNFSIGCNERVKKGEEWVDQTEWVNVVCFGKTAEAVGQHMSKGSQVYVDGRMQTRKWQDKEGKDRWTTEVLANQVLFLGKGTGGQRAEAAPDTGAQDDDDNSIPF